MSSPFHPRIGRPRPERPRAHWRPAGSRPPSYLSSTRRSTSAKGTWAKAPKRGLDLSLPRVRRGGGEAGQEAGEGSRVGQVRDLPAQGRCAAQALFVQVDGGRREELRGLAAVLTPGAVAARVRELLSEVRGEEGGLAAVVGGEGQHLVETGDLPGLSFEGALVEGARQGVQVLGPAEPAVGVAQTRGADFQQSLLGQIVEGPHQPVAGRSQGPRRR